MSQHPYSASVSASEQQDLQQSLFPLWHNRRHSHTTDMILEKSKRKSGSFEALQDMVQKQQSQQDDDNKDDDNKDDDDDDDDVKITTAENKDNKPPGPSIFINKPTNETTANADEKKPKIRRSVKFTDKEDDGSNFIKN
ncbi:hypothetical protein INT46_003490 [Mucor plumbeus]|uniref:Uncharacterized protein n=1 Tax=Mucor plumbeus TaxID=97098 RepID=A0A8H7QJB5_9FUNG|nr:hypothetical protein INT46_003490 [Mucor plumbeus]